MGWPPASRADAHSSIALADQSEEDVQHVDELAGAAPIVRKLSTCINLAHCTNRKTLSSCGLRDPDDNKQFRGQRHD